MVKKDNSLISVANKVSKRVKEKTAETKQTFINKKKSFFDFINSEIIKFKKLSNREKYQKILLFIFVIFLLVVAIKWILVVFHLIKFIIMKVQETQSVKMATVESLKKLDNPLQQKFKEYINQKLRLSGLPRLEDANTETVNTFKLSAKEIREKLKRYLSFKNKDN